LDCDIFILSLPWPCWLHAVAALCSCSVFCVERLAHEPRCSSSDVPDRLRKHSGVRQVGQNLKSKRQWSAPRVVSCSSPHPDGVGSDRCRSPARCGTCDGPTLCPCLAGPSFGLQHSNARRIVDQRSTPLSTHSRARSYLQGAWCGREGPRALPPSGCR
jgi:hypothetical protein